MNARQRRRLAALADRRQRRARSLRAAGPSGGSTAGAAAARAGANAVGDVPLATSPARRRARSRRNFRIRMANDPQAVQQGHDLFIKMNCAGCHGYDAKGAMGPNLTDGYWRYGGVPAPIFNSIYEGRPQGMPAWNPALPPAGHLEARRLHPVARRQLSGRAVPAGYRATIRATTWPPSRRDAAAGPCREPPNRRAGPPARRASRPSPTWRRHREPASESEPLRLRSRLARRAAVAAAEPAMSYLHTYGPAGDPATPLSWGLVIVSIARRGWSSRSCCSRRVAAPACRASPIRARWR